MVSGLSWLSLYCGITYVQTMSQLERDVINNRGTHALHKVYRLFVWQGHIRHSMYYCEAQKASWVHGVHIYIHIYIYIIYIYMRIHIYRYIPCTRISRISRISGEGSKKTYHVHIYLYIYICMYYTYI